MVIYLLTFFSALGVTYLLTPLVRSIAVKYNAVDIPDARKVHAAPIPRWGGISIYFGFWTAIGLAMVLASYSGIIIQGKMVLGLFAGSTLLVVIGAVDDVKSMRATTKLIFQIIAALIVYYCGAGIHFLSNPFNGIIPLGLFAIPLSLFWIVGITNAMNLIDGLDGLAAGVTAISSIALFAVAMRTHQIGAAILMLAMVGAAIGFLRYNFFPASVFLGDSGSMLLGFILASSSIVGVLKTTLVVALFVPILILGVPIFDTLFAIGRRLSEGKHPFEADNKHIHHMLLRANFNKREAVLSIYIVCFILSFIALFMVLQK
ncbi:MAG: MraY family glycosyltransferase [Candidatus Margulisbacteria bacterium]|nr:MraY family glycosyltransferase [Candidatus Margulisiibacteriota bacterium]